MRSIVLLVSFLLLAFSFMGCSQKPAELTLGCETSLLPSLVWVAEHQGYFQQEGLKVKIKEFGSGRTALKTMLEEGGPASPAGRLDLVTVAQTPVMFNSFNRNDYAIIAGMVKSDNDVKVLVRKDRRIKTALDLKGKKIGVTMGSTGHFFLGLYLAKNGISLSECELVNLEASNLAAALIAGQVDAISVWEPHIYNAQKALGKKALLFPTTGLFREDFYFVTNKYFLKKNPKALKSFLRAVKKAEEFIRQNKEAAQAIVSSRLRIDLELTRAIWDDFSFGLFLDQSILEILESEASWAVQNKLAGAARAPNYLNYVYLNILEEVKPEAVTIIR